jgi:hypothetical protein
LGDLKPLEGFFLREIREAREAYEAGAPRPQLRPLEDDEIPF